MKLFEAILILSGMIIGVGMFGIPFSFARAGFWLGLLELLVLTVVVVTVHILYGFVVLKTPGEHRLPGYMKFHLGRGAEIVAVVMSLFAVTGSLLAYIIIGVSFLNSILERVWGVFSETTLAFGMVVVGALVTRLSLKKEAFISGVITSLMLFLLVIMLVLLAPKISTANLKGFDLDHVFLPYGILLFALAGTVAIPDVVRILQRDRGKIVRAIVFGTLIPAFLYLLFAVGVVGVSGSGTSEEAIFGLQHIMGGMFVLLGAVVGFLAVYTSYVILSSYAQELLEYDFGVARTVSWILVSVTPILLYLLGLKDFIMIIGIVGTVAGGVEFSLILAAYSRIQSEQGVSFLSYFWKAAILILVFSGIAYELQKIF